MVEQQQQQVQQESSQQVMARFEEVCEKLHAKSHGVTNEQRQQANLWLKDFSEEFSNMTYLGYFLENSQSQNVQFTAASALKKLVEDHITHVSEGDMVSLKSSALNYLINKGTQCNQQVLKMIIMLLVKIVKVGWNEYPPLQSAVQDLLKFGTIGERHLLISLTAMEELIVEMGYVVRGKNLHSHRRIAVNFRDTQLHSILMQSINFVVNYTEQVLTTQALQQIQLDGNSSNQGFGIGQNPNIMVENLLQSLIVLEKCLNYDWSAILCNETLEEYGQTNVPLSWSPILQKPELVQLLFRLVTTEVRNTAAIAIKIKSATCLQHLAFIKHSIFQENESRIAYVTNFMQEVVKLVQSPALHDCILRERQVYKEVLPVFTKLQINFQVRDLLKAGDALFEGYISELFKFTKVSYQSPSVSIIFHASKLNHIWQRVFLEAMGMGLPIKTHLQDMLQSVATSYIDGNLAIKGLQIASVEINGSDADDEDENFEKGQRTQKQDDLESYSRLLKLQIVPSLQLVLERVTHYVSQYELALQQNNIKNVKAAELQLEYLIRVSNALLGNGLPSSSRRLQRSSSEETSLYKTTAYDDNFSMEADKNKDNVQKEQEQPWQYLDFQIVQKQIYLCKLTTQIRQANAGHVPQTSFELSLITFAVMFKNYVLTDSRIIMLGLKLAQQKQDQEREGGTPPRQQQQQQVVSSDGAIYNENQSSYTQIAQFCGFQSMEDLLLVFVDKLIQNLMTLSSSKKHEDQRLVKVTLECFQSYLINQISCRHISKIPVVKQLATAHVTQFQILQGPSQMKELGQFFKVLTLLWVNEEYVSEFTTYLDQLVPQMNTLFSIDAAQLKAMPNGRVEVMKLFYILKGVTRGIITSRTFKLFFEWLYPKYFSAIIEGALNAFHDDDQVVLVVVKFLTELVFNRNNRLRFDTWSIDGLIVFKETAKYVVQLLTLWDCLQKKQVRSNAYTEKWIYLKQMCHLYSNVITGSYLNFAICEYYNDTIFTVISQTILSSIVKSNPDELRSYAKVDKRAHLVILQFFTNHLELFFTKFEGDFIEQVIRVLLYAMSNQQFEVQTDAVGALNLFNEFVFQHVSQTPSPKTQTLIGNVQSFFNKKGALWSDFLRQALTSVLFEESRNIWIFQKWLFSTIVIIYKHQDLSIITNTVVQMLNIHEKNEIRKQRILEQFNILMTQTSFDGLDIKSKDAFSRKFNNLKSFVVLL